jgi:DNA polymerase type B, organellar and viral
VTTSEAKGRREAATLQYPVHATPYEYKSIPGRIAIFDTETDPFAKHRIVKPFAAGFYLPDTGEYYDFWDEQAGEGNRTVIDQFFEFLDANYSGEKLTIYCHNGGNFDFYFMLDHFKRGMKPLIINGRLARIYMGNHEFRDSYSAIPIALDKYKKTAIDYAKFERPVREGNRAEIRAYLKDDCVFLSELLVPWLKEQGDKLTMASVALPRLLERHGVQLMFNVTDKQFRPYYFGGRVECFETGITFDDWRIYDVNSMYPYVMAKYQHPVSAIPVAQDDIDEHTNFAHIRATSKGALPMRTKSGGLAFPHGTYDFFACIHEIKAGLETGTLEIHKVYVAWRFGETTDFNDFVQYYYAVRLEAKARWKASGETDYRAKAMDLWAKLILNSAYGKLAQDPSKYKNFIFDPYTTPSPLFCEVCTDGKCSTCSPGPGKRATTSPDGWTIHAVRNGANMWSRPQVRGQHNHRGYFNVATAASITSAARAELWRGIQTADRPIYCDTDSIICRGLPANLDPQELGAWKLEAGGNIAAIGGKKLYAVFMTDPAADYQGCGGHSYEVKRASKGVRLTAEDIAKVAAGAVIEYEPDVPKFDLEGGAVFQSRTIKATSFDGEPEDNELLEPDGPVF